MNLHTLLKAVVEKGGSDLHITVGSPPQIRVDGIMHQIATPPLDAAQTKQLCYSVLTEAQKHRFEEETELDFAFSIRGLSRFRGNIYQQKGAVAGAFRAVPHRIVPLEELGLPPVVAQLTQKPRGLILVTGPTGSGKSTTLAAMIDRINNERQGHIITIEDPIEFVHPHKKCMVNQREVGADTESFRKALKYILRQDPDVVLIGEMRDQETVEAALSISETGHLALATLHTNSAVQTINRILDLFPANQQDQVRAQLSFVLEGVITQNLLPRANAKGRVLAAEVMIPNVAIRNLIREDKIHQIYSQMQVGQAKFGMQTMNQHLAALLQKRLVTMEEAMSRSSDVDELRNILSTQGMRAPVR